MFAFTRIRKYNMQYNTQAKQFFVGVIAIRLYIRYTYFVLYSIRCILNKFR